MKQHYLYIYNILLTRLYDNSICNRSKDLADYHQAMLRTYPLKSTLLQISSFVITADTVAQETEKDPQLKALLHELR